MAELDPQPGDVYFTERWNAHLEILKRGVTRHRGESVWVRVIPIDASSPARPIRIYTMKGWENLASYLSINSSHEEARDGSR